MTAPRKLTLPLTVWSVCTIFGSIALLHAGEYVLAPETRWSSGWIVSLVIMPTFIVSILIGLVSSLGASIGAWLSAAAGPNSTASRRATAIGAGLGAVAIGGLPLSYFFSNFTMFGDPMPITLAVPLTTLILFVLNGGFAFALLRRRATRSQNAE